jgi:hypothetical protein
VIRKMASGPSRRDSSFHAGFGEAMLDLLGRTEVFCDIDRIRPHNRVYSQVAEEL